MMATLIASRRFAPLFWCQFFSALNDNFLKNALVFLILFVLAGPGAEALVTIAGAVFIAPFFVFSALGGELADRYDKALVARRLKFAEIGAAGLAVAGFLLHSVPVLFAALFAFGTISALFGPIKYGILPDHLRPAELPAGNALVEAATFIAIVLGTLLAGIAGTAQPVLVAVAVMAFSVICWISARFIPPTGEAAPTLVVDRNLWRSTRLLLADLKADSRLWRGGIIVSLFWLIGAVVMALLPSLVGNVLGGAENVVSAYLVVFAVSIAIGSALASWLCNGRIVLVPVPVAAVVIAFACADLAWTLWGHVPVATGLSIAELSQQAIAWRVGIDLAILAVAGGVFIVPSFAAVQSWAPVARRARVVAAVNVLSAVFMVAGAVVIGGLQAAGASVGQVFAVLAVFTLASSVWVAKATPTSLFADFVFVVFRLVYRMEVKGLDNIAKAGPNAIIALNHVSLLDAAAALAILEKDPVFAIDQGIARRWWVKPFLKLTRAMPLDPTKPMATRTLIKAVQAGETLVIFPEGRISVTGSLMKVYDGAGLIAEKTQAMVVPVRLEGLEATPFSYLSGKQVRRRWFPKVTVTLLEPVRLEVPEHLKGKARRQAAGARLYGIMSDLVFRTTDIDRSAFAAILAAAKTEGASRIAVEDPVSGKLTYRKLLMGARLLGGRFQDLAGPGEAVGVMLPSANAAAATVLGVMSAGRVPAMINFTAGAANVLAACKAAKIGTVVTARGFVEKAKLEKLVAEIEQEVAILYLEDVRAGAGLRAKLDAFLNWDRARLARSGNDAAAILFTSGSEGAPKGVVLSGRNLLANAAQAAARIDFGREDKVFNVLPVFHSFGLTVGLVLPLVSGVPVYLYPSPLHYRIVPELVYASNATILFGTDTFLAGYARSAHAYDFRSLRYVLAGAEPVKEQTRRTWMEKFGLRVLEGYGITETAPVLAINTPMFNRFGTVGRMMPGMEARLEAVDGITEGGRLYVRGPNVMLGYVKADAPGVLQPPEDGWHDTGDIVTIDEEGFITIRGRAKRFAKIAGEMVSLAAVEALAAQLWPDALSAIVARPDPRKGERLVLVTEKQGATRSDFAAFAKSRGAAELMLPSSLIVTEKLPMLGSGKTDYPAIAGLVAEAERRDAPPAAAVAAS
ncbi:acyl-[ACP]--phospholipid O-acyltransferase [Methylobrevis albus]|uniref:Acyl-[ACP]--phospholipid O-acyltransferase n=1 Tax=Methylobrevis albus TaxID=2793297 RepID=A0A931MX99_9HYPH|nr:acyl-[ACP]--phospholipid O-acyltransferase [Methylobrevis albus]MBH0238688.1 acyl-[ACP]--phospholipid O-acyltransferase [Methylobrevis albus]